MAMGQLGYFWVIDGIESVVGLTALQFPVQSFDNKSQEQSSAKGQHCRDLGSCHKGHSPLEIVTQVLHWGVQKGYCQKVEVLEHLHTTEYFCSIRCCLTTTAAH